MYIADYPRTIDTIILGPGNRADVMVKCKSAVEWVVTSSRPPGGGGNGDGGAVRPGGFDGLAIFNIAMSAYTPTAAEQLCCGGGTLQRWNGL